MKWSTDWKRTSLIMVMLLTFTAALGVQSSMALCGASQGYGQNTECYTAGTCYKGIVWCEVQRCGSTYKCPSIVGGPSVQCTILSCLNPFNNNCECV